MDGSGVHSGLILPIQVTELLDISGGIFTIGHLMRRVDGAQGLRNGVAEHRGMLQRQPNMLIIMVVGAFRGMITIFVVFMGILVMFFLFVVVMLALLHPLNCFFYFHAFSQNFHQVHGHQISVGSTGQGVLHPGIRFAACVEKQVAVRDGNHIVGGRLEAVEIHPIVQEHRQLHVVSLIPQDFPNPVVLWENGGDNPQLFAAAVRDGRSAAAGQEPYSQGKGKQNGNCFFHMDKTSEFTQKLKNGRKNTRGSGRVPRKPALDGQTNPLVISVSFNSEVLPSTKPAKMQ